MKRLLTTEEAAEYCGIGVQSFRANCTTRPRRVRLGKKGLRYDLKDLDEWIDNLPHEGEITNVKTPEQWLQTLDGAHQNKGRQSVPEQRDAVRVPPQERKAAA